MSARSAERQRTYAGPALLSAGFRLFFLLAALWAASAMALWILMLAGRLALPSAFDPLAWHAHEMIFGYGGAVVCGFLLTAVPNWTGRLPVTGPALGLLALAWLTGRVAVGWGADLGPWGTALIDLAFPTALCAVIAREIVASGNRRNLPVLLLCLALLAGNAAFHGALWTGGSLAQGLGARLGISALVLLIMLIGGRIVPSFTRNWLARQAPGVLPVPPGRFDDVALGIGGAALGAWTLWPGGAAAGILLLAAAAVHTLRLARWAGWRCLAEPLVWVLHLAYGFVPLGLALVGAGILWPQAIPAGGALHAWLVGAVGLMTLAVMTRASLGHTGRALTAGAAEVAIYGLVLIAALARLAAGFGGAVWVLHLAGAAWIGAFALFATAYWTVLTGPRLRKKPVSSVGPG